MAKKKSKHDIYTPFVMRPNLAPLEPGFHVQKPGEETPESGRDLIRAVMSDNWPAVQKHLALGADPEQMEHMSFWIVKKDGRKIGSAGSAPHDALSAAARSAVDPRIVKALAEAAFSRRPGTKRPQQAFAESHLAWRDWGNTGWEDSGETGFYWGKMTLERHAKSALSFAQAIPPEEGLPWKALADEEHLEQALLEGAARLAQAPLESQADLANEALAVCAGHGRFEAAARCLAVLGSKADIERAQVEAAIAKDERMQAELALPLHAYAIAAGQIEWIERELQSPDLRWVSSPAPARPHWTPLAAALEAAEANPAMLPLARSLLQAGASADALAESPLAAKPIPLVAARALALDHAGLALLLPHASPESLNQLIELAEGGKTTALGAAALAGDEPLVRSLLSRGADPKAIPRRQLQRIAQAQPLVRPLLGDESALSAFSRAAVNWASRLARPAAPSKPAPTAPSPAPEPEEPSSAGSRLDVASALFLAHAAGLPHGLIARMGELAQSARELAPDGELPADPADALQLRRLWEHNIPRFLSRLARIPLGDRAALGDQGEPSAMALLEGMLESAGASMAVMRQRALKSAHVQLSAEAAVICDSAGRAVDSFKALVSQTQPRAEQPRAPERAPDPAKPI